VQRIQIIGITHCGLETMTAAYAQISFWELIQDKTCIGLAGCPITTLNIKFLTKMLTNSNPDFYAKPSKY
jgi:hypothetical protein